MSTNSLAIYQLIALYDVAAHQAPILPFTVGQAHEVMRIHIACRAKHCARKAAARQVLIDAGRMVPDTSKPR
ncbi:hypothetical protein IU486_09815 [Streptomyces gardneri]|uniref:hypothetical protein n=1 Tax=Nocardia TaxID=1817 RepID=UPI001358DEE5|nr:MULTISPECIES: hypothetical protein [Nocardia]MBF6165068.1 hypothetical protein [Streptomyces gardneri]MBF6206496.1 hypothetical protein [Streptomyces gardneri]